VQAFANGAGTAEFGNLHGTIKGASARLPASAGDGAASVAGLRDLRAEANAARAVRDKIALSCGSAMRSGKAREMPCPHSVVAPICAPQR
jgi:hypothetical protein